MQQPPQPLHPIPPQPKSEEPEIDEEERRKRAEREKPPGNGGKTEHYVWTQTEPEVTIHVKVPEGTRAKDLKVNITPTTIEFYLHGKKLFGGNFHKKVISDECFWQLETDTNEVNIYLVKANRRSEWWSCVIEGEGVIDVKKIIPDPTHISELDPEARAVVEKMMFDQRQKQLGLPTSEEIKRQKLIEEMMKAPGCPPGIDFSNLNFVGN